MNKSRLACVCIVAGLMLPAMAFSAEGEKRAAVREFVKDSVITTKVKAELAREKPSTLVMVSVDTDNSGVVVLKGTAKTQADRDRAEAIARRVEGVTMVENDIEVKPY